MTGSKQGLTENTEKYKGGSDMYNFIDVTETSEGVSLPSEALQINGEFIENLISGYRTLTVEGREALSPEVTTYETGIRDGSTLKGRRYPARTIRITYQLIATSNEAFREAYNKLASILDVKDAQLIFNDETDKFFIGTPALIGEVQPGRNAVVGEFEILCLDPFKYSVMEYEAIPEAGESSILIDYGGTYRSYPKLQADFYKENETTENGESETALTGKGDCGYVAFFNEDEKIIQIGDPDEEDGENAYEKSQTLVNQQFKNVSSYGGGVSAPVRRLWVENSGITTSSAVVQTGAMGMAVASYSDPVTQPTTQNTLLTVKSTADSPYFHYTVTAKATRKSATTCSVTVIIKVRLDNTASYFGKGYGLSASVYIGGEWRTVQLKSTNEYWEGTSSHQKSFTKNVYSLNADTTVLTDIQFRATRTDSTGGRAGTVNTTACSNLKISPYYAQEPETYYLKCTDYGTGTDWHGASVTRTIPADAAGVVGASNFTLTYSQKMCIGRETNATNELGAFQCLLVSGSGSNRKIVAGVNVYKGASGKKAKLRFYLNNTVKQTMDIDLSYNNAYFKSAKSTTITKSGMTVTFNVCGIQKTFWDANINTTAVNEVTFTFTQFGTRTPLSFNGLYWAKFVKHNCDTWVNVPNKFGTNDVVEADCKTGGISLNGVSTPALGALGNDWEDFYLTPGLNQIGYSYSNWVEDEFAPSFKLKYREVFL